MLAMLVVAAPSAAQQRDSLRAGVAQPPRADTTVVAAPDDTVSAAAPLQAPMSPRRAFLTSLAFPGYAQARFDRPTATALFVAVEAAGVLMLRKSLDDLQVAKRLGRDSLPAVFATDPATGLVLRDAQGAPVVLEWLPPPYSEDLIRARRTHLEDWIAVLVFNHLIAGADAFVSAHLWDVPVALSIGAAPGTRGTRINASFRW
ncbi:MAG: hypothetical protein ACYC2G_10505 [Gemmatimonadaceae bacterium]